MSHFKKAPASYIHLINVICCKHRVLDGLASGFMLYWACHLVHDASFMIRVQRFRRAFLYHIRYVPWIQYVVVEHSTIWPNSIGSHQPDQLLLSDTLGSTVRASQKYKHIGMSSNKLFVQGYLRFLINAKLAGFHLKDHEGLIVATSHLLTSIQCYSMSRLSQYVGIVPLAESVCS